MRAGAEEVENIFHLPRTVQEGETARAKAVAVDLEGEDVVKEGKDPPTLSSGRPARAGILPSEKRM